MDELSIRLVYEGKKSLKNFAFYVGLSGMRLEGVGFDERECRGIWNGWIKTEDKIQILKNICPICFLGDITGTLNDKENIPIEIYLTLNSSF